MKFPSLSQVWARWVRNCFASLALIAIAARTHGADTIARMDAIVQKHVAASQFTGAVLVARRGATLFDRAFEQS